MVPHKTRALARSLVASEVDADTPPPQTWPATVRVYEKLRQQLGAPMGVDAFQALASRALVLAKLQSPGLSVVEITANGDLRGLDEVESHTDLGADEGDEAGVILIAQLLGLFLAFLGEATTLRLIEDLRLQANASTEQVKTTADTTASVADAPVMAAAFAGLLQEIDRLRSVSTNIEILAYTHSDMEAGLLNVVGNIRNLATILDVFTLIRSKAGGTHEDTPHSPTIDYVN
jgi:hypothetical protein